MTITHRAGATDYGLLINGVEKLTVDSSGNVTFVGKVTQAVQSMVRLITSNGYGSINTKIGRFTTVVTNQGSDITYADSATLGATFTINTNGVYAVTAGDGFTSVGTNGLSLNSTQLTTSIGSINQADVLSLASTGATGNVVPCGGTFYLTAGSVIRFHTDGIASAGYRSITITRVA